MLPADRYPEGSVGQRIEVGAPVVIGDTAVLTTDRGFTGMDGYGFDSPDVAAETDRVPPAGLALRLFSADPAVTRVYVAASEILVTRSEPWDEAGLGDAAETIAAFFLHYPNA